MSDIEEIIFAPINDEDYAKRMRRHSEKKYPQISVSRETYEKLRALKFELEWIL